MAIVDTRTGREISGLWLIPFVAVFLVGLFFYAVTALTLMAVVVTFIDSSPTLSAGPVSPQIDRLFVYEMFRFDGWLVSFVGLSSPWLATIPGLVASAAWERATGGFANR
jgi:hypothetical protein